MDEKGSVNACEWTPENVRIQTDLRKKGIRFIGQVIFFEVRDFPFANQNEELLIRIRPKRSLSMEKKTCEKIHEEEVREYLLGEEKMHKHTQRPPVHTKRVAFPLVNKNFRGDINIRSGKGVDAMQPRTCSPKETRGVRGAGCERVHCVLVTRG
jgi:hypothetical protein